MKAKFHKKKNYSVVMKLNRIFALHFFENDLYQAGTLRQHDVLLTSMRRNTSVRRRYDVMCLLGTGSTGNLHTCQYFLQFTSAFAVC